MIDRELRLHVPRCPDLWASGTDGANRTRGSARSGRRSCIHKLPERHQFDSGLHGAARAHWIDRTNGSDRNYGPAWCDRCSRPRGRCWRDGATRTDWTSGRHWCAWSDRANRSSGRSWSNGIARSDWRDRPDGTAGAHGASRWPTGSDRSARRYRSWIHGPDRIGWSHRGDRPSWANRQRRANGIGWSDWTDWTTGSHGSHRHPRRNWTAGSYRSARPDGTTRIQSVLPRLLRRSGHEHADSNAERQRRLPLLEHQRRADEKREPRGACRSWVHVWIFRSARRDKSSDLRNGSCANWVRGSVPEHRRLLRLEAGTRFGERRFFVRRGSVGQCSPVQHSNDDLEHATRCVDGSRNARNVTSARSNPAKRNVRVSVLGCAIVHDRLQHPEPTDWRTSSAHSRSSAKLRGRHVHRNGQRRRQLVAHGGLPRQPALHRQQPDRCSGARGRISSLLCLVPPTGHEDLGGYVMNTVICRPLHGSPNRKNERAVSALAQASGFDLLELSGPNLNLVRSALAEAALRERADVILWIDSDMVFSVEAAMGIVTKAWEANALVGALYAEKAMGGSVQAEFDLSPGTEVRCWEPNAPLVPCKAIGLGLAAHPASLLTDTADRIGLRMQRVSDASVRPWFTPTLDSDVTTTDDYVFCRNLRQAGFSVWADPRWRVEHIGEYGFTLADCVRSADTRPVVLRAGWVV